jgi:hypothetical protein
VTVQHRGRHGRRGTSKDEALTHMAMEEEWQNGLPGGDPRDCR